MLELAILGVLKEQQLHGYELKKRLTDALGAFSSVSFGALYPALARLEAAGAVRVVEE
ncbi:MAG: PadR family transcriptional regulator, partial [Actinomycetota bacterium]|nr:PadR family transcriptional regulator [Actinomycetota bacterium]